MPKSASGTKSDLIPYAPKPWKKDRKPLGLFVNNNGISKETARSVWEFFDKPDFPWKQRFKRFKKTAHHNVWHCGPYVGDEQQAKFERECTPIHTMVHEATASMNEYIGQFEPDSSFRLFTPESVNVHIHKPGWGLGAHYDDSHEEGRGMVMMITVAHPDAPNPTPRTFLFTDPVGGYEWRVQTPNCNVVVFKDAAYDFWRHESIRNPNQTGDYLSLTVRKADVDGYNNRANDRKFLRGAPAAEKTSHKRMREKGWKRAPGLDAAEAPAKSRKVTVTKTFGDYKSESEDDE